MLKGQLKMEQFGNVIHKYWLTFDDRIKSKQITMVMFLFCLSVILSPIQ